MTTRVKICGIVRPEDGAAAARFDADAIGIVFTRVSPRCVNATQAREIIAAVPAGVSVVGLFLDPSSQEVELVLKQVELDVLQFHGSEPPEFCRQFDRPYIKTLGFGRDAAGNDSVDPALIDSYADAAALLFDSNVHGAPGGTGRRTDWAALPAGNGRAIVLAGGLTPHNVAEAIRTVRPFAVDVSSGVEDAPGVKNHSKMQMFINEVRRADTVTI